MSQMKRVIFTISKNNNITNWAKYHLDRGFEIFVIDNGNLKVSEEILNNHSFHIDLPKLSQTFLGHVNQQEFLMNKFYSSVKEKNVLIYFIDDDEFIVENEPLKGNTYLNWRIFNGQYFPETQLNEFFKPVAVSCQNITLKIHSIIFNQPFESLVMSSEKTDSDKNGIESSSEGTERIIFDGNGNRIDPKVGSLKGNFKNYLKHVQFTSVQDFNKRLSDRPVFEESEYFRIRLKGFWECCSIPQFQMCVIMDNYDKLNVLRKIYPNITFFVHSSVVPEGGDIEVIPLEYWICPEMFIFKYAEENHFNIILKRASKIKTKTIDIEDEFKEINLYRTIHHYPILKNSKKVIKRFKQYGFFDFLDIIRMNKHAKEISNSSGNVFESKSFLIECERMNSDEIDETIGMNMFVDIIKTI